MLSLSRPYAVGLQEYLGACRDRRLPRFLLRGQVRCDASMGLLHVGTRLPYDAEETPLICQVLNLPAFVIFLQGAREAQCSHVMLLQSRPVRDRDASHTQLARQLEQAALKDLGDCRGALIQDREAGMMVEQACNAQSLLFAERKHLLPITEILLGINALIKNSIKRSLICVRVPVHQVLQVHVAEPAAQLGLRKAICHPQRVRELV
mmetsp:Transcript_124831/g.266363  ORF Transcript_124831/g.266363 Transcript_124831/m.266363 type:complete len:207 (+) Transcript_124831:1890-2510(+)